MWLKPLKSLGCGGLCGSSFAEVAEVVPKSLQSLRRSPSAEVAEVPHTYSIPPLLRL